MKKENKPTIKKNKIHGLRRILKDYFKSHPLAVVISIICILLSELSTIAAPLVLQNVTNLLQDGLKNGYTLGEIWNKIIPFGILLVCAYVISIIGCFVYTQINTIVGQKYMHELRVKVFTHMQDLPVKYFDSHDKGDIMSVYINDIDTIRELLTNSMPTIIMSACTFISVIVMMSISSLRLTFGMLVFCVLLLLSTVLFGAKSSRNFIAQQKLIGRQEGYAEEMMAGLKVVKSFCHEEESKEGFDHIISDLCNVSTKAHKYANILGPINGNIGNIAYVSMALIGTLLFIFEVPNLTLTSYGNTITVGIIVSFLPMVRNLTASINQLAQNINSLAMSVGGSTRVCELLDEVKEVDDGYVTLVRGKYNEAGEIVECSKSEATLWAWKHPHKDAGDVTYTLLKGDIRMFDVDFGYVPDKIVLHDVSLYAEPGQKVAFVGATGAGKTTITNLINRFYDIADGKVRYDGININKISKKDLRRSLGMVLQDTNLFSGTIMDNIRYGRLDATDEECIEAAKLANADSFITRLPNGYNTVLTNDGTNLSQGQRQLLSIARAAVADAPVMILDEATSSIDTRTESIVTEGMDNLMKGRTVFVIAHRLSTIQNSNVIMVLDHGRIIERGTHEDLIKLHGFYYRLYTGSLELE